MLSASFVLCHYNGVIMSAMASPIASLAIVFSTVYFRRRSKKTSKLRVTGLCSGIHRWPVNSPAQRVSNAEKVYIWWRNHSKRNPLVDSIHEGPVLRSFDALFLLFWTCCWKKIAELLVSWDAKGLMWRHCDDLCDAATPVPIRLFKQTICRAINQYPSWK